jgi:hypothetical protein
MQSPAQARAVSHPKSQPRPNANAYAELMATLGQVLIPKEKDGYRLKSPLLTRGHSLCLVRSCAFFSATSHCWWV